MASEPRPLCGVVISQDESLLHEISWVLEAVGYQVQTSSDFDQKALWRRYAITDFVILDGRAVAEPAAEVFAIDSDNPTYRLFLYDPAKRTDLAAWFAAGAHDALRTPLSRGEVLARLRTGARYLEFERRLKHRSLQSVVPGMYSRRGFIHALRRLADSEPGHSTQHAVLATSIDWYEGITRKCGEGMGHSLVNSVARAIQRVAGDGAIAAYFGGGRFATLLTGRSLAEAKSVAETLAHDFGGRESRLDASPRPTLTSAVIPWTAGDKADRLVTEALETLHLAETSGGDCVVLHGEFSKELAAWQEEMSAGNPFSNVVAQDVMEPFPALLEQGAEPDGRVAALQRAGIAMRPYVDGSGHLVGVAENGNAGAETRIGSNEQIAMPETISHNASFPEIYEAFSSRGCSTLVVTADNHPLGYLTCEGFLSMIDPITSETFANTSKSAEELTYLAVPSVIGVLESPDPVGA
jgi:diguanylate cyclase (GGDEF)-like protein